MLRYRVAMERRGFLRTSFLGGLAVGGAACASNQSVKEARAPLSDAELERTMRQLDRALAGIRGQSSDWYLTPERGSRLSQAQVRHARMNGELMRSSLRSMLVTSTVSELPEASRKDPRVTSRLDDITHEADFAALGTLAKLQALKPEELAELDEELRRNPDVVAGVVDEIDAQAVAHGVSPSRRRHLRNMARHVSMELRRNSSSVVVEHTLRQAQRVMERHATLARPPRRVDGESTDALKWAALTNEAIALYDQQPTADPFAADPLAPAAPATPGPVIYTEPPPPPIQVYDDCQCHPSDYSCVQAARCHKPFVMYKDRVIVRADAERYRLKGGILIGVGLALMIPGAIFAPFTLGLTGFAITGGVIMLIIGIVFMVRGKRLLDQLDG